MDALGLAVVFAIMGVICWLSSMHAAPVGIISVTPGKHDEFFWKDKQLEVRQTN